MLSQSDPTATDWFGYIIYGEYIILIGLQVKMQSKKKKEKKQFNILVKKSTMYLYKMWAYCKKLRDNVSLPLSKNNPPFSASKALVLDGVQ